MMLQRITIMLLLVLVLVAGIHTLTSVNQDIGRHLTLGKIIWDTHAVPRTNLFSFTAPDFPFINHHWLGEVLLYIGSLAIGLRGLIIIKACMLMAAFAIAFLASYRKEQALPTIAMGLVALSILVERTDVRPEILSFLFFSVYLWVCFRAPWSRWLWILPVIQVLWVNSHIYFFMGPLTYGLFMIGNLFKKEYRSMLSWRHPHIVTGLLIGVATLMNPFGLQGALYPLRVFHNYGYSVVENQTPFFLRPFGYPQFTTYALYLGILTTLTLLLSRIRQWRAYIFPWALAGVTAWLALDMIRNFPLFALAMMPICMHMLSSWKLPLAKISWTVPVLMAALIYTVVTGQIYAQMGIGKQFGLGIPWGAEQAVDFFRAHKLKGPIFNNFDIGSFLIWKLPEEKVFIDGRPEAYPADFIQKVYIPMQEDPVLWKKYSEQYRITTVFWNYQDITPWSQAFLQHITQNPEWPMAYRDDTMVIFVKK